MYNTDLPSRAELPSSRQLLRSTLVAAATAGALLVTVVWPAEYGIDPTGVGRVLGLTDMGQTKMRLAQEAAADAAAVATPVNPAPPPPAGEPAPAAATTSMQAPASPLAAIPAAQDAAPTPGAASTARSETAAAVDRPAVGDAWRDEVRFTLAPGEGTEIKLRMEEGERAYFAWSVQGGVVNYDTHGDGGGRSISYVKGRGVPADEGELVAAFTGNHGWFWRNRDKQNVTVTLRTRGDYSELLRVK